MKDVCRTIIFKTKNSCIPSVIYHLQEDISRDKCKKSRVTKQIVIQMEKKKKNFEKTSSAINFNKRN